MPTPMHSLSKGTHYSMNVGDTKSNEICPLTEHIILDCPKSLSLSKRL